MTRANFLKIIFDYLPAALMAPLFFLYSSAFNYPFLEIKQIYWFTLSFAASIYLIFRRDLQLPDGKMCLALSLVALGFLSGFLRGYKPEMWLWSSYGLSGILMYFYALQLTQRQQRGIAITLVSIGILELSFWAFLQVSPVRAELYFDGKAYSGHLGNSEFLAALFGVGIFLSIREVRQKILKVFLISALVFGLVIARSKGSLALVTVILGFRFLPKKAILGLGVFLLAVLTAYFYKVGFSGVYGRLLTWIVAAKIGWEYLPFGTGAWQLKTLYFSSVENLFLNFPSLKEAFGPHSSFPLDAHNLPLQLWMDFGLVGFSVIVLALFHLRSRLRELSSCVDERVFLLAKVLYTVVVGAATGLTIFIFAFANPRERRLCRNHWIWRTVLVAWAGILVLGTPAFIASYEYQRGYISALGAKFEIAEEQVARVLRWSPEHANALLVSGFARYRSDNKEGARESLLRAVEAETSIDTLKQSAAILFHAGYYRESIRLNKRILTVYPEHLVTMARIAQAFALLKKPENALEFSKRILETSPRVRNRRDPRFRKIARELIQSKGAEFKTW